MKKLIFTIALILSVLVGGAVAAPAQSSSHGDWMLYNNFDAFNKKVVDTPSRTYFLVQGQYADNTHKSFDSYAGGLFVYDKEADELLSYTARNYLNDSGVINIFYNSRKRYLVIVYENGNIDLLHDDDSVYNIPGLKMALLQANKTINDISFDAANNRAYVATAFGYIVIDDKKNVIMESHIYNQNFSGIARVGDYLVAATTSGLIASPVKGSHSSINDFVPVKVTGDFSGTPRFVLPLDNNQFAVITSAKTYKGEMTAADAATLNSVQYSVSVTAYTETRDGYLLHHNWATQQLHRNGSLKSVDLPATQRNIYHGSWDFNSFWFINAPYGFINSALTSGNKWEERNIGEHGKLLRPNAPMGYRIFDIEFTPEWGMLGGTHGCDRVVASATINPFHISTYKDGEWTNFSPRLTQDPKIYAMTEAYGPVVDPANHNMVYFGTYTNGLAAYDLANDVIYNYTSPRDAHAGQANCYSNVFPSSSWNYCRVSRPSFDKDGTIWFMHDPQSVKTGTYNNLYYWTQQDRLAGNVSGIKSLPTKGYVNGSANKVLALQYPGHTNMLVMANCYIYGSGFSIFDHRGTLGDTSDDRILNVENIYDRDGNRVVIIYVYEFIEDPATGLVWMSTSDGVFNFDPATAFSGNDFRVNRIKVARNDGTNLADYLLDGVPVHDIAIDGAGRKWFATLGNGVTVTSGDGQTVVATYTTENSYLPSNEVYSVGADPYSNAVWMGTAKGLCKYMSDAVAGAERYDNVVAYPNPVRPDYFGYVTIEGLMDKSLVKIVDASGNLVKELGVSNGGMLTWDVTNMRGERVRTGVYYIAASNAAEGKSDAAVGKILVVN